MEFSHFIYPNYLDNRATPFQTQHDEFDLATALHMIDLGSTINGDPIPSEATKHSFDGGDHVQFFGSGSCSMLIAISILRL